MGLLYDLFIFKRQFLVYEANEMPQAGRIMKLIRIPKVEDIGMDTLAFCRFSKEAYAIVVELYKIRKEVIVPRVISFYIL